VPGPLAQEQELLGGGGGVITLGLVNAGRVIGVQKDWRELRNSGRVEFNHAADAET
jgi:hypothetical protein